MRSLSALLACVFVLGASAASADSRVFIVENQAGKPHYNKLEQESLAHDIERVGKQLRARMPWLKGEGNS